MILKERLSF